MFVLVLICFFDFDLFIIIINIILKYERYNVFVFVVGDMLSLQCLLGYCFVEVNSIIMCELYNGGSWNFEFIICEGKQQEYYMLMIKVQ